MPNYTTRTMSIIVLPEGEQIFSEMATIVSIDDEAAGEFVSVKQNRREGITQEIKIDVEEWPTIREAIERMIAECKK